MDLKKKNHNNKKTAIIIAGASLTFIADNDELKENFLKITLKTNVVLACRVSPK